MNQLYTSYETSLALRDAGASQEVPAGGGYWRYFGAGSPQFYVTGDDREALSGNIRQGPSRDTRGCARRAQGHQPRDRPAETATAPHLPLRLRRLPRRSLPYEATGGKVMNDPFGYNECSPETPCAGCRAKLTAAFPNETVILDHVPPPDFLAGSCEAVSMPVTPEPL